MKFIAYHIDGEGNESALDEQPWEEDCSLGDAARYVKKMYIDGDYTPTPDEQFRIRVEAFDDDGEVVGVAEITS